MKPCPYSWRRIEAGYYTLELRGAKFAASGDYRAEGLKFPWAWSVEYPGGGSSHGWSKTLAEAKAAAFASFERRVAA